MHSIETFIKLFRDETQLTHVFNETVTLQNIRQDFPAIAQASGFPPGDISMAYVAGSYARGQQTAHSDIDIECYSAAITQEYQSTFKWKGYLISFSVYPAGTVRGEPDNLVDRSWARSCYKTAQPVYDPHNAFAAMVSRYADQEMIGESDIPNGLWKTLRKVIEYKRKMLSAIETGDTLVQNFAAVRFIESYAVARNILVNAEISSEKAQFDVLKTMVDTSGETFHAKALRLLSTRNIDECRLLTRPFLDDLIAVLEGLKPGMQKADNAPATKRP